MDEDGDKTMAELVPLPKLVVGGDWVEAYDFRQADQIALIEVFRGGSSVCSGEFDINGAYNVWLFCWEQDQVILPGDLVTLSVDGEPIKDHIVQYLTFDVADFEQRRFAGTAYSGSVVELVICDSDYFCLSEYSSPVSDSSWEVTFADIPFYVDWFGAFIADEDGDQTQADLTPPPTISYHTSYNWFNVNNFPPDSELFIEVFTDTDMAYLITSELLYTDNQGNLGWDVMNYLDPGSFIVADYGEGEIVKELVVEDLRLENVDLEFDQASGYAPEDVEVFVVVDGGETGWFEASTIAGYQGWFVDFGADHAFDLNEEHFVWVYVVDEDGDQTMADIAMPQMPIFTIQPDQGWVCTNGWLVGEWITLTIAEDENFNGTVIYDTQQAGTASWDENVGEYCFEFYDMADQVFPGQYVSVAGDEFTKDTWIVPLTFDSIDEFGYATGSGPAGRFGHVCLSYGSECQAIEVQSGGIWTAYFDLYVPDVTELFDAHVVIWDEDWDETMAHLAQEEPSPMPYIRLNVTTGSIRALGWPLESDLTLKYMTRRPRCFLRLELLRTMLPGKRDSPCGR